MREIWSCFKADEFNLQHGHKLPVFLSVSDGAHHSIKTLVKCIFSLYNTDATLKLKHKQLEYMSPDSYKRLNHMMSVTFHPKIKSTKYKL